MPPPFIYNVFTIKQEFIMSNQQPNVTFMHLRRTKQPRTPVETVFGAGVDSFGGITVAMKAEADGSVTYAYTRCHSGKRSGANKTPGDRYVKKEGRARAQERLLAPADDVEANKWRHNIKNVTPDILADYILSNGTDLRELRAGFTISGL
jgi:hypothetical protein